jgi:hypothetical protein
MKPPKKKEIFRVISKTRALILKDGEIHFILRDNPGHYDKECICLDYAQVSDVMKKEASKPLLLLREE